MKNTVRAGGILSEEKSLSLARGTQVILFSTNETRVRATPAAAEALPGGQLALIVAVELSIN